jgi:hypothetical protein
MLGCVLVNLNGGLASWQREPSNSVNIGTCLVADASAFVFIPAFVAYRSLGMKTQTPRGRLFAPEALLLKTGSVVEPTLKLL